MKKRTFLTVFLAVMLVAAAAFAYFTWSATIAGNTISTGEVRFDTWGGPINVSGLMPGGPANVSYIAIQNVGDAPSLYKAYVGNFGGNTEIAHSVLVKVTLNPGTGPYSFSNVYNSAAGVLVIGEWRLDELTDPMSHILYTPPAYPMAVGEGAVYKVEVRLDPAADNAAMNKTMSCDWTWMGGQVEDPGF